MVWCQASPTGKAVKGHEMDTKLTNESDKRALILRLKRVEGQLRGVQQLIEKNAPCESVAQQLSAARRALDKAFHEMVGCLIESKLGEYAQTDPSNCWPGEAGTF